MRAIKLTTAQHEAVEWALDAMQDYWLDEIEEADPDGEVPRPVVLPALRGRALDIENVHGSVLADLKYRLTEQRNDLMEDLAPWGANNRAGRNAWGKIEKAAGARLFGEL